MINRKKPLFIFHTNLTNFNFSFDKKLEKDQKMFEIL